MTTEKQELPPLDIHDAHVKRNELEQREKQPLASMSREKELRSKLEEREVVSLAQADHVMELEARVKEQEERLKYATHFFDSPASFSDEEFAALALKVYGKEAVNYHGRVPHLQERCEAEARLREMEAERDEAVRLRDKFETACIVAQNAAKRRGEERDAYKLRAEQAEARNQQKEERKKC